MVDFNNIKNIRGSEDISDYYDRFVNVILYRDYLPESANGSLINTVQTGYAPTNIWKLITPRTGYKPEVAVQYREDGDYVVSNITVSIKNCRLDTNLTMFNRIRVALGYYKKNTYRIIDGEITGIFHEGANPNGVLSIQAEVGNSVALWETNARASFWECPVGPTVLPVVLESLDKFAVSNFGNIHTGQLIDMTGLPVVWKTQKVEFPETMKTEVFSSLFDVVKFLNQLLSKICLTDKSLPPLYATVLNGRILVLSPLTAEYKNQLGVFIDKIKAVSISGVEIGLTTVFIPAIEPFRFFYTVIRNASGILNAGNFAVNYSNYAKRKDLIFPNSIEVKFATNGVNEMKINGIIANQYKSNYTGE